MYMIVLFYIFHFTCLGIWHYYRWKSSNFDLWSALVVLELWRLFSLPHLLWHGPGIHLSLSTPRNRDTYTCCRAFGTGAVTTWFYDLCVSCLGFQHETFRMWCERSNRLRRNGKLLLLLFRNLIDSLVQSNICTKSTNSEINKYRFEIFLCTYELCYV